MHSLGLVVLLVAVASAFPAGESVLSALCNFFLNSYELLKHLTCF